jgi:hypothetical protein
LGSGLGLPERLEHDLAACASGRTKHCDGAHHVGGPPRTTGEGEWVRDPRTVDECGGAERRGESEGEHEDAKLPSTIPAGGYLHNESVVVIR